MQLVDNDTFIKQLTALFATSNQKGSSVWITHKRLTYHEGGDAPMAIESDDREYPCLLRVTNGKKIKFSTQVSASDLNKFHTIYGTLLKNSMPALRKRDKKREKERAERFALRKKKLLEDVKIEGPKRGNGRKKRLRLIKAWQKQETARKRIDEREKAKLKSSL
ncbi:signal recognition particle, SRP9/SRP14 subunit [Schizopora paradoxa]|uniref:Signal recognition particle subunit SRP14 n=1 Tax=Schizopora paradoxa TaxID=27342 RepID=A0A0H2SU24_9AGAM|nr:signal recognition particle, SRP9/SRP14 subunit [Schizopora paradoxa]